LNSELEKLLRINDIYRAVRESQEEAHQQKYRADDNIINELRLLWEKILAPS
jgi:hypothetical protein